MVALTIIYEFCFWLKLPELVCSLHSGIRSTLFASLLEVQGNIHVDRGPISINF